MRRRGRARLGLVALALVAPACGKGCSEPASPPAPRLPASAPVAPQTSSDADMAAKQLAIDLPDRRRDDVLPGLSTLPRRKLVGFAKDRAFVVRLDRSGVDVLEQHVSIAQAADNAALEAALRTAAEDYQRRAGVAASRVVLAIARDADRDLAARLRSAAHAARPWRVVALAREDFDLFEVILDPPPARRP